MRRTMFKGALAGALGFLMLAGDASACCHKKRTACAPAPCATPCAPTTTGGCGHARRQRRGLCHRKHRGACTTTAVCYAAPMPAPWGAPTGQVPTGQVP
jgi:hypothetical protein